MNRSGSIAARRYRVLLVLACVGLAPITGCSVNDYAVRAMGDALAASSDVYGADDDVELVGAATPFGLKTIESLLASAPDHAGLLLAAARGFTQYAYAFVEPQADALEDTDIAAAYARRERARRLYLRARDYGLRGLEQRQPDLKNLLRRDPHAALDAMLAGDVALLYWTGVAWAGAIVLSKDDPFLLADLPAVEALMRRALALDESYEEGAIHVFLISFEMSQAGLAAGAQERAREHFDRAVRLSEGRQAAPFVALAEAVSTARRDRGEFEAMLARALAVEVRERSPWRLANLVMQRRARWLLARADRLFTD